MSRASAVSPNATNVAGFTPRWSRSLPTIAIPAPGRAIVRRLTSTESSEAVLCPGADLAHRTKRCGINYPRISRVAHHTITFVLYATALRFGDQPLRRYERTGVARMQRHDNIFVCCAIQQFARGDGRRHRPHAQTLGPNKSARYELTIGGDMLGGVGEDLIVPHGFHVHECRVANVRKDSRECPVVRGQTVTVFEHRQHDRVSW